MFLARDGLRRASGGPGSLDVSAPGSPAHRCLHRRKLLCRDFSPSEERAGRRGAQPSRHVGQACGSHPGRRRLSPAPTGVPTGPGAGGRRPRAARGPAPYLPPSGAQLTRTGGRWEKTSSCQGPRPLPPTIRCSAHLDWGQVGEDPELPGPRPPPPTIRCSGSLPPPLERQWPPLCGPLGRWHHRRSLPEAAAGTGPQGALPALRRWQRRDRIPGESPAWTVVEGQEAPWWRG